MFTQAAFFFFFFFALCFAIRLTVYTKLQKTRDFAVVRRALFSHFNFRLKQEVPSQFQNEETQC